MKVYWEQAERLAQAHGVKRVLATVTHNRGILAMELGKFEQAEAAFRSFVDFCRVENHSVWLAVGLDNLGTLAFRRALFEEANQYYSESLAVTESMDGVRHFPVLLNQAMNALAWNKLSIAETLVQEGLTLARQQGHPRGLCEVLRGAGDIAQATGESSTALEYWQEGFRLASRIGLKNLISDISRRLGDWYTENGEFDTASHYLTLANENAMALKHEALIAHALFAQARLAMAQGRNGEAENMAEQSLALFESIHDWHREDVRIWLENLAIKRW